MDRNRIIYCVRIGIKTLANEETNNMDHLEAVKQHYIKKPYQFWVDVIEGRVKLEPSDDISHGDLKIHPEWENVANGPVLVTISEHELGHEKEPERLTSFVVIPPGADEEHTNISN